MRVQSVRLLSATALLALAAGCAADPAAPSEDEELLSAFEMLAAEANRSGDGEAAASLSGATIALRMGVRPSVIDIEVNGESVRHFALVAGVARGPGVDAPVVRHFLAWTGPLRLRTLLEVSLLADQGAFGDPATVPPMAGARGRYTDLVERARYLATGGTVGVQLASLGEPCGRPLSENPNLRCRKARWNVRLDGEFHRRNLGDPVTSPATRVTLVTGADGVNGILVAPAQP